MKKKQITKDVKTGKEHLEINLSDEVKDKDRKESDRALIKQFREKNHTTTTHPKIKVEHVASKGASISYDTSDPALTVVGLLTAFGTTSLEFKDYAMSELLDAACKGNKEVPYSGEQMNGVLAAMQGIAPRDEVEAMLASQMVATHFASMNLLRRLKNSETIPVQDSNGNMAVKLMRTFTAQMEALNRYRGKGQQKVTVEHVHVHAGGQAIVGNVTRPEGGGVIPETEEQPHAKQIDHAPLPEMPSANPQEQPVPIPCHA